MWLVVYKEYYYPSVFECSTRDEAEQLYNRIKEEQFNDPEDQPDDKLYMTEIIESCGDNSRDVEWSIDRG